MKDKYSVKGIYAGAGSLFLLVTGIGLTLIFMNTDNLLIRVTAAGISVLQLMLVFVLLVMLRKRLVRFTVSMNCALEAIIADEMHPQTDLEDETLMGKFHHNLKRMYEITKQSKEQLMSQKKEMQEMISDISHQSRTPLTNLKIYNATLQERHLPPDKEQEFYAGMETQIDKLDFLIQSMLKMSRLETGVIELSVSMTPIYDTIGQALTGILPAAEKKSIEITVECDETIMVPHDRKWTAEAIFNILDNAVKYTEDGGRISVRVQRWEMMTKIDIADTGRGIPEQHLAQIFKRFYREKTVHDVDGVGLGLNLSREIISRQGGYIQVLSEPGKGSDFSVFLLNERQP